MNRTVFGRRTRAVSVGDALSNLVVPLLSGLAVEESNDNHGHVIASDTARLRVGGKAVIHHVFANLFEFLLGSDSSANKLDDGLRGLTVPDTWKQEYISKDGPSLGGRADSSGLWVVRRGI